MEIWVCLALGWFLGGLAVLLAMFFCILLVKEDKEWEKDKEAAEFVEQCLLTVKKTLRGLVFTDFGNPYLFAAALVMSIFLEGYLFVNGTPGIIVIMIAFFLLTEAIVDNTTEILPDTLTIVSGCLFLAHGINLGLDYRMMLPCAGILCLLYLVLYIWGKGRGDMKLLGVMTIGAGPVFAIMTICAAFIFLGASSLVSQNRGEKALAPFLCLGAILSMIFERLANEWLFLEMI